ncbi:hypothetical protein A1A1_12032 [Planococcus antarcticus DSM 14505]|uniref:Uncharacterized protein n=1 Tax=Planococcus antarcticus DSM 14505 TaxID=1185653 RepID=A0AA87IKG4_9BACL|nr:hypothetical protein A1A1_12032 [Planococcus antarcticus DSM 14505]
MKIILKIFKKVANYTTLKKNKALLRMKRILSYTKLQIECIFKTLFTKNQLTSKLVFLVLM